MTVLASGTPGSQTPDGLFDVLGIGEDRALRWPDAVPVDALVIIDDLTEEVDDLLGRAGVPAASYLTAPADHRSKWRWLPVGADGRSPLLSPYVPVSEVAARHRHRGFGFTGYQLVLAGGASGHDPPGPVAWLTGAFHDRDIVVVADGIAAAWKGRALRGRTSVDTRMDLWRLMAHAAVCVDLDPGRLVARECVEALRLGTPIVVPEPAEPAATHARAGGGSTFGDAAELIAAVGTLSSSGGRAVASDSGRRYADAAYGDPERLVGQLKALL
ncbi:MAG TPA: hypothetical protein VK773_07400 [Acidimicrobiales bacterium]|nr:hypothetical protein [Acidimicrobiales bacterium]